MRARLPALVLAAAGPWGCDAARAGGGGLFDDTLSCDADPHAWYDGLVMNLMVADADGSFAFDPPGDPLVARSGTYDLDSGAFSWEDTYAEGYWLTAGRVEGYGAVSAGGDLDLLYAWERTDVLGETTATRVRMTREGCAQTTATWDVAPGSDLDAVPAEDPLSYAVTLVSDDQVDAETAPAQQVDGDPFVDQRQATSDLVVVSDSDLGDGAYLRHVVSRGDGTSSAEIEQYGDYDLWGTVDTDFAGGRHTVFDAAEGGDDTVIQSCDYTVDYAGDGGGVCAFLTENGWIECDLSLGSDGTCLYDCGSAGEYDCS
jgi:hypothetical protein